MSPPERRLARPAAGAGGDPLFYAGYVRTETEAAAGGILRGLSARADGFAVGGRLGDWELRHLQPPVVVSGRMDLALADGYAALGGIGSETFHLGFIYNLPPKVGILGIGYSVPPKFRRLRGV